MPIDSFLRRIEGGERRFHWFVCTVEGCEYVMMCHGGADVAFSMHRTVSCLFSAVAVS